MVCIVRKAECISLIINLDPELKAEIEQRDYNDKNRDFAPLTKALDAIEIDTSFMTIEQVIKTVLSHIEK